MFSEDKIDKAKEIINIALAKAGDSLSFFIKQRVIIKSNLVSFENVCLTALQESFSHDEYVVLKTEIKGDLSGVCFLMFNKDETERILELALPANVLSDEKKKQEFGDAFLLEIDNIVTASVVTQFSNLLNYKMYGYVPSLQRTNKADLSNVLKNECGDEESVLSIKTQFITDTLNLEPVFLWFFKKENFIEAIDKLN